MGSVPSEGVKATKGPGLWEQQLGVGRSEGPHQEHRDGSAGPQSREERDGSRTGVAKDKVRADNFVTLRRNAYFPAEFREECMVDTQKTNLTSKETLLRSGKLKC